MRSTFVSLVFLLLLYAADDALAGLELLTPSAPTVYDLIVSANGERAFCRSGHDLFRQAPNGEWTAVNTIPAPLYSRAFGLVKADENLDTFLVKMLDENEIFYDYYRTTDGGQSFHLFIESTLGEVSYDYTNHETLYDVGGNWLRISNDGGETWEYHDFEDELMVGFYQDPLYDTLFWAYGQFSFDEDQEPFFLQGGLIKSTDGGATWQQAVDFRWEWGSTSGFCHNIIRLSNGKLFAMVDSYSNSQLVEWWIQSEDNGEHWSLVPDNIGVPRIGTKPYLLIEDKDQPGTLILTGSSYSGIYRSEDFGASWVAISSGLPSLPYRISTLLQTAPGSPLLLTLDGFGIYASTDHGLTWQPEPSPRIGSYGSFSTSQTTLLSLQQDRLHILQAPFSTWQAVPHPSLPDTFVFIDFPTMLDDGTLALVYRENQTPWSEAFSGIALSSDLGESWVFQPSLPFSFREIVWMNTDSGLVLAGGKLFDDWLCISRDTGRTWQIHEMPSWFSGQSPQVVAHRGSIYVCTEANRWQVWKSDNLGESWIDLNPPNGWSIASSRIFPRGEDIFMTQTGGRGNGDSLFVWKYANGEWQELLRDSTGLQYHPVYIYNDQNWISFVEGDTPAIVVQVGNRKLMVSQNEGETWTAFPFEYPEGFNDLEILGHVSHAPSNRLWFNTSIGTCYLDYSELGIDPVTPEPPLPQEFTFSAYPNPFNSNTQIEFTLQSARDVNLVVYDALGRRVSSLLDKRMTAGAHTINWNANGIASGTYFVQLKSGETNQTRKLILLK